MGWIFVGQIDPHKFPIIKGKVRHPRALSLMIKAGHMKRDDVKHWVTMPGKFKYLLPLDQVMRQQIEPFRKPYPKKLCAETAVKVLRCGTEATRFRGGCESHLTAPDKNQSLVLEGLNALKSTGRKAVQSRYSEGETH
jgi:hypothetical protein